MRGLDGVTDSMDMSLSELWEIVERSLGCAVHGGAKCQHDLAIEQQQRNSKQSKKTDGGMASPT